MTGRKANSEQGSLLQSEEIHSILAAAKEGDDLAVRTLVGEAMAFVHPSISKMLHQRHAAGSYLSETLVNEGQLVHVIEEDAWDLTHATCVTMLKKLDSFKGRNMIGRPVRFTTWLYAIAQNKVRSTLRTRWRERRRRQDPPKDADRDRGTFLERHGAVGQRPIEEAVIEEAELALIKDGLHNAPLTEEQRDAVIMFVVMGYPQQRIAQLTGVQIGTVKKRVFDGLRKLRDYVHAAENR